ncbi:recombination regulator RecX [Alcaligenaceae bacterium LF4-65]|jgi:regulatory protein|uniref:Regulatory protein RecX n=1 Tax=Zwartia hollandica TaxID=324606 RepID=A0A953T187_9BURK|nr:recombination regulator RecX [Zwartia hollandica]MBZ1349055.1 recombination regulator RecX [Zwartia hollandica]
MISKARPGLSLKARAIGLLSRREHTRLELERKLTPFAESAEELAKVLDELSKKGWQSDERYAQGWVHRKAALHGAARIAQDLRLRGISASQVAQAQELLKSTELDRARAVWQKKFAQAPKQGEAAEYARQGRFLLSRGFSSDVVHKILGGWEPADM